MLYGAISRYITLLYSIPTHLEISCFPTRAVLETSGMSIRNASGTLTLASESTIRLQDSPTYRPEGWYGG